MLYHVELRTLGEFRNNVIQRKGHGKDASRLTPTQSKQDARRGKADSASEV
jgi:hypothetical protein